MTNLQQRIVAQAPATSNNSNEQMAHALWQAEQRHKPGRRRMGWLLLGAAMVIIANIVAIIHFAG